MKPSKAKELNPILIPKWLCHWRNWHRWFWTSRNRSFISGKCSRCGMTGIEFWKRERAEYAKDAQKKK